MIYNRRRNIYTLGEPNLQTQRAIQRRQNSDPFERDPFKIQSYNFHYADRPAYTPQNLSNYQATLHTAKRCDRSYYGRNYSFTGAMGREKEAIVPQPEKCNEFRRRKYFPDFHNAIMRGPPIGSAAVDLKSKQMQRRYQEPMRYQEQQSTQRPQHQQQQAQRQLMQQIQSCGRPNTTTTTTTPTATNNNNNSSNNKTVNKPAQMTAYPTRTTTTQYQSPKPEVSAPPPQPDTDTCQWRGGLLNRTSSQQTLASVGACGERPSQMAIENPCCAIRRKRSQQQLNTCPHSVQFMRQASIMNAQNEQDTKDTNAFSTCHIHININGLDEAQLNDNLTIKINANPDPVSEHDMLADDDNDLNVEARDSTCTFIVDKQLSKCYLPKHRPANRYDSEDENDSDSVNLSHNRPRRSNSVPQERMPSRIAWPAAVVETANDDVGVGMPLAPETTKIRRLCKNYSTTLKDIHNMENHMQQQQQQLVLQEQQQQQHQRQRHRHHRHRSLKGTERKVLNTTPRATKLDEYLCRQGVQLTKTEPDHVTKECSYPLQTQYLSTFASQRRLNAALRSPLNVNINVYTDRFKLMRV